MNHAAKRLALLDEDRDLLESWVSAHNTPQALSWRAQIVLQAAEGLANTHIAEAIGVSVITVREWRKRFASEGIASLTQVKAGRGRKRLIEAQKVKQIVHDTLHTQPKGATHWSCRTMAKRHLQNNLRAPELHQTPSEHDPLQRPDAPSHQTAPEPSGERLCTPAHHRSELCARALLIGRAWSGSTMKDRKFYRVVGARRESNRPGILAHMPDVGASGSASSVREGVRK